MRFGLIAVEGWADSAFTVEAIKHLGITEQVKKTGEDSGFWNPLIPKTLPKHKLLWERLKVPHIFQSDDVSVAVYAVGGYTKFDDINFFLKLDPAHFSQLSAFGVVIDADDNSPQDKVINVVSQIPDSPAPLLVKAGIVNPGNPKTGIYVIPNNKDDGALEHVLIEAGAIEYNDLMVDAKQLVDANLHKHHKNPKPYDSQKAQVSAAASILQPDASLNVSIRDDKWVSAETYKNSPMVGDFVDFLAELLGVDKPA